MAYTRDAAWNHIVTSRIECDHCGTWHRAGAKQCPNCKTPNPDYVPANRRFATGDKTGTHRDDKATKEKALENQES